MLKLKKIHLLGFKSFCDRTELTVPGTGIAVVVGPNGCGKSNILDGVSWVLGEQSAKSLRGTHMQDVIFAGTRDRKALGMAEVTLTLVDPEAFEGPIPVEPEVVVEHDGPVDWDEDEMRRQRAVEAEEIIAAEQPGQSSMKRVRKSRRSQPAGQGPQAVVLKIRRRKFQRTPQKGEIVVTRRLFRTGESEYLLNGKLCRLRDIQDIFMGTGLGPESYAIIGQERIAQLLSSKPHDRRAIIEEAAGITRFKNKKRLGRVAPGEREAEPCARGRYFRRSDAADEQPEAPGGQGGAVCGGARRVARTHARGAGQPHGHDGCGAGAAGAGDRRSHGTDQRFGGGDRHAGSQPARADGARLRVGPRGSGGAEPRQRSSSRTGTGHGAKSAATLNV